MIVNQQKIIYRYIKNTFLYFTLYYMYYLFLPSFEGVRLPIFFFSLINLDLRPADVAEGGSRFPTDSSGSLRSWYTPEAEPPVRWWGFIQDGQVTCKKSLMDVCISHVTPIVFWIFWLNSENKWGKKRTPVIWQDLQCVQDWVYMSSAYKSGAWRDLPNLPWYWLEEIWILFIWSRGLDRFHLVELDF